VSIFYDNSKWIAPYTAIKKNGKPGLTRYGKGGQVTVKDYQLILFSDGYHLG
jgi:hypothetical protein